MKISNFITSINQEEQRSLVLEYQNAVLEYYFNNIYITPSLEGSFVVQNLMEILVGELKVLISSNNFVLTKIIRKIKEIVNENYLVVMYKSDNLNDFYYSLKVIFEKTVFEKYVKKQYSKEIETFKLKEIYLPILKKYNKSVSYKHVDKNLLDKGGYLKMIEQSKSKYMNLNEEYRSVKYINDEVLNLSQIYNERTFATSDDISTIIDDEKYKYIMIPFEFDLLHKLNESNIFESMKRILEQIQRKDEYYLIIPKSDTINNYICWRLLIEQLNQSNIKIGFILTTFEAIYDFENFEFISLIVIDYDEFSNFNYDFEYFKSVLLQNLRTIKLIAKEKKAEVIIKSNNLGEERIIEKLIIMGFKTFFYNENHYNNVKNSVVNYMSRRGKYRSK